MSEYTAEQYVKDYCRRNHEDARKKEDWLKEVKNTEEWAISYNNDWLLVDGQCKRDRKSTRLNSSHSAKSRMPSSA